MKYDIKRIEEDVKRALSNFRYQHTMNVASEAKKLARYYKIDEQKAYVASLLHDMAKEFSEEENESWIENYHLPKELLKKEFKKIKHADIGAVVAREYYDIEEDIYDAIKYHTIGNKNMNLLAKIVFVADKVGRENLNAKMKEVKKVAYQNLDEAMRLIILIEKEKLKEKGFSLHSDTIELLKKIENK